MNPWLPLAGTLGFNVACHLVGLPTICSTTRKYVPRKVAMPLLAGGAVGLLVHVWRGY
ncbi:hypothetical protein [Nocardioides sp. WS12]|uniref:hypothetical protein n=1 Tax=Nocardioides sp. WS12 TaxID=2486272 RepID=UPI0015F84253|nr:hypothetical protein [Nocardioides sp. WS12]